MAVLLEVLLVQQDHCTSLHDPVQEAVKVGLGRDGVEIHGRCQDVVGVCLVILQELDVAEPFRHF